MNKWLLSLVFFYPFLICAQSKQRDQVVPYGDATRYLDRIEILSRDGKPLEEGNLVARGSGKTTQVNLGLGEAIAKLINLYPKKGKAYEYRIEQQFETSLSLMDEGPHMDLLNWKHHVSEWKPLERVGKSGFVLKELTSNKFPVVTREQIIQAVSEQSALWARKGYAPGDRWVKIARRCNSAKDYPAGVSISKVRLRISVKIGKAWKEIQTIDIMVPMGC